MYSCLSFWDPRIWYANVHSFQAISEEVAPHQLTSPHIYNVPLPTYGPFLRLGRNKKNPTFALFTKDGNGLGSYLFFFGRALSCLLLRFSLVHLTSGTMFNNIYGSFVGNNASQNIQTKHLVINGPWCWGSLRIGDGPNSSFKFCLSWIFDQASRIPSIKNKLQLSASQE